jgi:hypothetical protein
VGKEDFATRLGFNRPNFSFTAYYFAIGYVFSQDAGLVLYLDLHRSLYEKYHVRREDSVSHASKLNYWMIV